MAIKHILSLCAVLATVTTAACGVTEDWFEGGLKERTTPLYICPPASTQGATWRFPAPQDCTLPNDTDSSLVNITIYYPDSTLHLIESLECYKQVYTISVSPWCIGNLFCSSGVVRKNEKYVPISRDECRHLKAKKETTDGQKLGEISPRLYGTSNNRVPKPKWLGTVEEKRTNYYLMKTKFTVTPDNALIKPIGVTLTEDCRVTKEHCETTRGMLLWNKDDYKSCKMTIGTTTPCLRTGSRITCKQTFTAISGYEVANMCGQKVLQGHGSGLMFTSSTPYELHHEVSNHEEVYEKIKDQLHQRKKRELPRDGLVTTSQFQMHYQYILSIMEDQSRSLVTGYHLSECRQGMAELAVYKGMAVYGFINPFIAALMGDNSYRGRLSGDAVQMWRCGVVTKYNFQKLPQDNENCFMEIPVTYEFNNNIQEGWLQGNTHEILKNPQSGSCPSSFYFETMDGELIDLTQGFSPQDVPSLPNAFMPAQLLVETDYGIFAPEVWRNATSEVPTFMDVINDVINGNRVLEERKTLNIPKGRNYAFLTDLVKMASDFLLGAEYRFYQFLAIGGITVIVLVILLLKNRTQIIQGAANLHPISRVVNALQHSEGKDGEIEKDEKLEKKVRRRVPKQNGYFEQFPTSPPIVSNKNSQQLLYPNLPRSD